MHVEFVDSYQRDTYFITLQEPNQYRDIAQRLDKICCKFLLFLNNALCAVIITLSGRVIKLRLNQPIECRL